MFAITNVINVAGKHIATGSISAMTAKTVFARHVGFIIATTRVQILSLSQIVKGLTVFRLYVTVVLISTAVHCLNCSTMQIVHILNALKLLSSKGE